MLALINMGNSLIITETYNQFDDLFIMSIITITPYCVHCRILKQRNCVYFPIYLKQQIVLSVISIPLIRILVEYL